VNWPVGGRLDEDEELEALLLLASPTEELELPCVPMLEELELTPGETAEELELPPSTPDELEPPGSAPDELLDRATGPLELLPTPADVELVLGTGSAEELDAPG